MSYPLSSSRRRARLALVLACAAALMAPAFAAQRKVDAAAKAPSVVAAPAKPAFNVLIEPAPAWVVPARERPNVRVDKAPMHYRVIDEQTRVDDKGAVNYQHVVRVVDDSAGLAVASQVQIEFDPSYQTLAWHHFDVVRDGKRLNRLDRRKIQMLQRETQLERRIYDGRVTASMVVDDVRVGDQIDFAYSIRGSNPVFEGRFVDTAWMTSQRGPVALYQVRLLAPEARKINVRVGAADIQVDSKTERGWRDTVYRRESVSQLHADSNAPYSVVLPQQLQFSEYADWAEVARWGQGLFAQANANAPALDQKAAEIKALSPEPEKRLLAALHFVQADVRYFGTEIGLSSHRPAPPDTVLAQRFGDCKDKVSLLVALLQRLDIPATPVLVSTLLRGQADALLPSPLAFDHVIARVELNGKPLWLDGTRGEQTGELANRQSIGFGKGLPLAAGTTALAALPAPYDTLRMAVQDTFRVARFADGVTLESRVTYRGDLAELMRDALATHNAAEVQTQLAAPYARAYPKLKSDGPMHVEASETDDALTLVQRFTIPEFWRYPEQRLLVADIVQWGVIDALRLPNEPTRRDPYMLAYPGVYRHASVIEYPEDVFATPNTQRFDDSDAVFALHAVAELSPRRSSYSTEVRLLADQIEAKDWAAHAAQIGKLSPRVALTMTAPAISLSGLETLKRQLKDADDSVHARKIKLTTRQQADALYKSLVLTAQIDGGRLSRALKAQALTARGIQYDHLGRIQEAARDLRAAVELAPDVAETLNAASVNSVATQDYPAAIGFADRVLAKNANDTEARNTRALARYFTKDYAAAKADFDELLKDGTQVRRGYPIVWLSLTSRQSGLDAAKVTAAFADDQLPTEWPRTLVDWARGKVSTDGLIATAKTGSSPAERLCEAYYYIGERYLAEGDAARAKEFFEKSVDQGVVEFVEDQAARNRLASLKR